MEWQIALLILIGGLLVIFSTGLPVAFGFLIVNVVYIFMVRGEVGLIHLVSSIRAANTVYNLVPLVLFIMMGEVMFHSKIAPNLLDAVDKWIGRVPGRLSLMAVGAGTLLAALTGVTMASVAILGSSMTPEMEKRGYKKSMALGPILGSGAIAVLIPPSAIAVFMAYIGQVSIRAVLVSIIVPGILLAVMYTIYIITRCKLQPSIAPVYEMPKVPLSEKLKVTVRNILPLGGIIFLVVGVIVLGIASPTEASALGVAGCFVLAASYGEMKWAFIKKAIGRTVEISVMILLLVAAATVFSQVLAWSGASRGLVRFAVGLPVPPTVIVLFMIMLIIAMGAFMDFGSIVMITLPLFMPVVTALGLNPIWFVTIALLALATGGVTPPFGIDMFVMKGVAPPDTTMGDIYKAALPFFSIEVATLALLIAFPQIVLWLPGLVGR